MVVWRNIQNIYNDKDGFWFLLLRPDVLGCLGGGRITCGCCSRTPAADLHSASAFLPNLLLKLHTDLHLHLLQRLWLQVWFNTHYTVCTAPTAARTHSCLCARTQHRAHPQARSQHVILMMRCAMPHYRHTQLCSCSTIDGPGAFFTSLDPPGVMLRHKVPAVLKKNTFTNIILGLLTAPRLHRAGNTSFVTTCSAERRSQISLVDIFMHQTSCYSEFFRLFITPAPTTTWLQHLILNTADASKRFKIW